MTMTGTGSSADIVTRIKQLIPSRWFRWAANNRDAILGGLADSASWDYGLILYAKAQTRLSTAYGVWLDVLAYDFLASFIVRNNLSDDAFRAFIKATILTERVTRAGMINAITTITGHAPWIFEPWNTFDTGAYSGGGQKYGSMGYGVGHGGYGNMNLPCQTFIKVTRGAPSGVPLIEGYGNKVAGWGVGSTEYIGQLLALSGITDAIIFQIINMTKPTGSICWVSFGPTNPANKNFLIFNKAAGRTNSQYLGAV